MDTSKNKGMYRGLKADVKKESGELRDEWERK